MKLFVAAMGASNYTYAEAVASEGLEDWIGAHERLFAFLGGVPKLVVPDNLKSAVLKPDRYDPGLNRTYAEMAEHFGTAILPSSPRKHRDKVKVEVAVQLAQRWILARLRNRQFFSLADLNAAIGQLRDELNMRVMRGYGANRADLFTTLDRPHHQPLLEAAYAFARGKHARVALYYHVEVDSSRYSVPFSLIWEEVDVHVTGDVVEIFHKDQRVASHLRCPGRRSHVTLPDHMPSSHRPHAEWTAARMLGQAAKLGPSSSPASSRSSIGMRPSAILHWRTRSSTVSSTTPIGSNSQAKARAEKPRNPSTQAFRPDSVSLLISLPVTAKWLPAMP